ncbi:hypothetical protein [Chryseobacterium flavum]|uniref:hypothetical protein n=1 Tax=Chryseobacterium flavum TaxID=415851 RepID=UPI0028AE3F06|nr:hypothetical protein [Chryseobacterium flavum]
MNNSKKIIIFTAAMIGCIQTVKAQVGINTTQPKGVFHVDSKKNNPQDTLALPDDEKFSDDFTITSDGRIGIGKIAPDPSAMLDIASSDKGVLIPKVVLNSPTDSITIATPASGLLVYNEGSGQLKYKGFLFWNGAEWKAINYSTTKTPVVQNINCKNASAFPIQFISGQPYEGVLTLPYTLGNGGAYAGGPAHTQNGLTFTLNEGVLNSGNGTATYSISGIPDFSSPDTISVPLNFLGNTCAVSVGNNSSSFAVGEVKSARITVPSSVFKTNGPQEKLMWSKTDYGMTYRRGGYPTAAPAEQAKYIEIKGLRMDFMSKGGGVNDISPKLYNVTNETIKYNVSSLSTGNQNIEGGGASVSPRAYSFVIDGDDQFSSIPGTTAEYMNVMLTFPDGEWYNCTWHATQDSSNYYFYMTAQRLN